MFSTDGRKSDPMQLFKLWLSKQPEGMKNTGPLYLSIINRPKSASSSSTQDSGMEEVIQSSEFVETETPCKCTLSWPTCGPKIAHLLTCFKFFWGRVLCVS